MGGWFFCSGRSGPVLGFVGRDQVGSTGSTGSVRSVGSGRSIGSAGFVEHPVEGGWREEWEGGTAGRWSRGLHDLVDQGGELGAAEGLVEEGDVDEIDVALGEGVVGEAGGVDDADVGTAGAGGAGQLGAVHAGHDDVGDEQIDGAVERDNLKGLGGRWRRRARCSPAR